MSQNYVLKQLTSAAMRRLGPSIDRVGLCPGFHCTTADEPIEWIHFPRSGIVALGGCGDANIGLQGREAIVGFPHLLGVDQAPLSSIVCVSGEADRVGAGVLRHAMEADANLRAILIRYVYAFNIQIATTVQATASASLIQRLARLILMMQDRVDGDEIACTHISLSLLLGVRRSSITSALHHLEGDHLVRSSRGIVSVRDRGTLRSLVGGFYGLAEDEYARVFDSGMAGHSGEDAL